jgi:hypothetical protein
VMESDGKWMGSGWGVEGRGWEWYGKWMGSGGK